MPRVTGTENIRQFWAQIWPLKATLTITPATVRVSGDLAVEEGNWTWSAPSPTGDQKDNGKYLVSWRKTDGKWRIVQDMWNGDNPSPPPPPAAPGS
jgi:ketosteroid isomerase-like protein